MKAYWHIHHDQLLEFSDNIEERIEYIKNNKPKDEVEIRLRLLKEVIGELPDELYKAREAYDKAQDAYDKAYEAYGKALDAYDKAWEVYGKALNENKIENLHKTECPNCPWNGKSIF